MRVKPERTIGKYTKGDITCFGCGGPHLWSKRQEDKSFVVICPNKDKTGIRDAAEKKIAEIRTKRKERKDDKGKDKKKQKTTTSTANAVFYNGQASSSTGGRKVFVIQCHSAVLSAGEHRLPMPVGMMNTLPHMLISLGPSRETPNCPDI